MVRLLDDIDAIPTGSRFVATVGVFDGVHLGHLHVLRALRELAATCGAVPVAITFEPHPQSVITGRTPELICDPDEKLVRMGAAGAELVVVQRFDEAFRAQTAEQFLERLAGGRDLAGLVMSPESAFGRDREGTVETVRRLAAREGWQLVEVDTLELDGARVSSGRIRGLIAAGDLASAARLLGRRYAITGTAATMEEGWWTVTPPAAYAMPPPGSYAIQATWTPHAGPMPVHDLLRPGMVEQGMAVIGDAASVRCSLMDAAGAPGDETVRVQWIDALAPDVLTTADPRLVSVLVAAREGCVYPVMNPELISHETT